VATVPPAAAKLDLDPEEREFLEWSHNVEAASEPVERIARRLLADDYLRRSTLLSACRKMAVWESADRWVEPRYNLVLDEAVRTLDRILADDAKVNAALENDVDVAVIFTYRSWDRPRRQAWLRYMRSADAKKGAVWQNKLDALQDFGSFPVDNATGEPNPA
jgi:hypothetical protein